MYQRMMLGKSGEEQRSDHTGLTIKTIDGLDRHSYGGCWRQEAGWSGLMRERKEITRDRK